MAASIEVANLSKTYPNGRRALKHVSFTVQQGEFVGILGSSGAGKSTLMRCLNGFEMPTSGTVQVAGIPVEPRSLREVRKNVGMIFQSFNLIPTLNVLTNVAIGRLSHVPAVWSLFYLFPKRDLELAAEALDSVGLLSFAYEKAGKLSGGQQQRVAIARSLAQNPKVLLADEPVASLDPVTGQEIMGLLQKLMEKRNVTVVANLHQVELAQQFCHRLIGLKDGTIGFDTQDDPADDDKLVHLYKGATRA